MTDTRLLTDEEIKKAIGANSRLKLEAIWYKSDLPLILEAQLAKVDELEARRRNEEPMV